MELNMPVSAYYFLLKSIPCDEPLLTPKYTAPQEDPARAYVEARQFWLDNGWVEMDLDGSIRPSPQMARLLYIISHREAVLCWEQEGKREYFVKGPVDMLQVVEKQGEVTLIQRNNSYLPKRMREEWNTSGIGGTLEVLHTSGAKAGPLTGEDLTAQRETGIAALAKLLVAVYGGEISDA